MDSDFLLIHRMKRGDMQALDSFVRKYYPTISRYCYAHTPNKNDAEDMTQETFARFFRSFQDYQHQGKALHYGKQQGTIKDLKKISSAILYLRSKNINTVVDLEGQLTQFNKSAAGIKITMQEKERRMWEISHLSEMKAVLKDLAPIHDAYVKIGFKKAKEKYAAAHSKELEQYDAAFRFVKAMEKKELVDINALRKEYQSLKAEYAALQKQLEEIQTELQQLKDIRYIARQVMPPEEKKSILEDLEEKKKAAAQRQEEQKQKENEKDI